MALAGTLKEKLCGRLPDELLGFVPASFDILGSRGDSVAIIEVPNELSHYETVVAKALMEVHGNVRSVLAKESERTGEYRLRELRLLAGDPETEVEHRESGCRFRVDPRLAYFSTRESTERERVASQVRPGEEVLVMFSGVAPFPICIARRIRDARVTGVEINPEAHRYGLVNIRLNKVQERVSLHLGDVRTVCPSLGRRFDRVVMPLPKGAHEFLDLAVSTLRPGGALHLYHWAPEDDMFTEAMSLISGAAERQGRTARQTGGARVSLYSPRVCKVRVDAEVS